MIPLGPADLLVLRRVITYLTSASAGKFLDETAADLLNGIGVASLDALRDQPIPALLTALATQASGSSSDAPVDWTPTTAQLGEVIGFVSDPAFSGNPTLPGITELTFNSTTARAGFDIENAADLTAVSFPNLTTIDPTNLQGGYLTLIGNPKLVSVDAPLLTNTGSGLQVSNNPLLTSINFPLLTTSLRDLGFTQNVSLVTISLPSLVSVARTVSMQLNTLLTSISMPNLVSVGDQISIDQNPALVSVDLSSFVPTNGKNFFASNCALNAASVNLILHRHVLNAGYVSGIIGLDGGTAAAPTGQGILDAATLSGRGVSVFTN